MVLTDSGGITEGTNELIGTDPDAIGPAMEKLFSGNWKKGGIPEKWDGHAAERIVGVLCETL
jgi:UDP-N-acetylglucosamine 2-epimerase (non-hydrolysing)